VAPTATRGPLIASINLGEGNLRVAAELPAEVQQAAGLQGNDFGDYVIVRPLGHGGCGTVYLAWQKDLGRYVALKVLHHTGGIDVQRLTREAHILANLSHPNIVPIHGVGEHEGTPYLAMTYVAGKSLGDLRLDERRALQVIRDVADAVAYAHRSGVVHRDLKPANVMIAEDGHVWVMDFGIARHIDGGSTLTIAGKVAGSPAYMPPEQAMGARCDERSDVYALGATLYELTTGQPPFTGNSAVDVLVKVIRTEAVAPRRRNPRLSLESDSIIAKAMEKKPERRYASAAAFGEDVARHLEGKPIVARPAGVVRRLVKFAARHPLASAVGAVTLLALATLLVGGIIYVADVTRARELAERERRAAELKLAESLVSQGDALGLGDRWHEAERRYAEARAVFARIGVADSAPDLGMLSVYRHAQPPLQSYVGQTDRVASVSFTRDGRRFLSASSDHSIKLWDVTTGAVVRSFPGHEHGVWTAALAPDGTTFVSGSRDGTVRLWEVDSGKLVRVFGQVTTATGPRVHAVAFMPDGRTILAGREDGTITVFDRDGLLAPRTLTGHTKRVRSLAVRTDGTFASAAWDGKIKLWDLASGTVRLTFEGPSANLFSVAFSPDGTRLLSSGSDPLLRLWDSATGKLLAELRGHTATICQVIFAADGKQALTASWDGTLRAWDLEARRELKVFGHHPARIYALALSPDGHRVLSAGEQGHIRLWGSPDAPARFSSATAPLDEVRSLAVSSDGRLVASGGNKGQVALYDVATGRRLRELQTMSSGHRVAGIAFGRNDATLLANLEFGAAIIWSVSTGEPLARFEGPPHGIPQTVALTPDRSVALFVSNTGARIFRLPEGAGTPVALQTRSYPGRAGVLTRDGSTAIVSATDGNLYLWQVATGSELAVLRGHDGSATALAISADDRLVASGSTDNTIKLWDLARRRELRVLTGHSGAIRAVAFSPDGTRLVSGSEDHSMRLWDVASGRELRSFSDFDSRISAVAFTRDGSTLLAGTREGLSAWDFTLAAQYRAHEAALLEARATLIRQPHDAGALATLGRWLAWRDQCDLALPLLQQSAMAVSPLMLARCHLALGDGPSAQRALDRAAAAKEAPPAYLDLLRPR
jgi:WD40 repeat protein/predicted Ser/Thr protein kinase